MSFAKVAEYQRRGLIHFHAIVRLDGPGGSQEPPPDWAGHHLLVRAIPPAVRRVRLTTPPSPQGKWELRWGDQLDIRPILVDPSAEGLSERAVAGYIAKYATKDAEASGTVDHRLSCLACAGRGRMGAHAGVPGTLLHQEPPLLHHPRGPAQRTRQHRATEARERHGLPAFSDATTLVLGHWRFAGIGYTPGEAIMAEHIRQNVQTARKIAAQQADE